MSGILEEALKYLLFSEQGSAVYGEILERAVSRRARGFEGEAACLNILLEVTHIDPFVLCQLLEKAEEKMARWIVTDVFREWSEDCPIANASYGRYVERLRHRLDQAVVILGRTYGQYFVSRNRERLQRGVMAGWQSKEWSSLRTYEFKSWRECADFRAEFWQDVDEHLAQGKLPGVTPRTIDYLATPIDDMEFTVRTTNCLKSGNCRYLRDVVEREEKDLLSIPNFGRKSLNEVRETLAQAGPAFGLSVMGTLS